MKSIISTIGTSISWAVLAAIIGTACWVFLTTFIDPLLLGDSLSEIFNWSYGRAINALYFGGFIAILFIVPYAILFFIYMKLKGRYFSTHKTKLQKSLVTFVLSLPLVITVFISTVLPTGSLGPFWREGIEIASLVLIATWTAIFLSMILVNPNKTQQRVAV